MDPVYISLGNDCLVAELLRNAGLRDAAHPFDWIVSYGGTSRAIIDATQKLAPASKAMGTVDPAASAMALRFGTVDGNKFNAEYGAFHMHAPSLPLALPTMARRFERLRATLAAADGRPVVLIRRSHTLHHHFEHPEALCNEVDDCKALARHLLATFPTKAANGGLRIELMLACDLCHPKIDAVGASEGLLRVHNLTRGPSSSFAESHPTKTYTDAVITCLAETICTNRKPRQPGQGLQDGPFSLEN